MGYQNYKGTYVKILTGKYAGQYGEAGFSCSDRDLVEVYLLNVEGEYGLSRKRLLLDVFQDIEVVKCPAVVKVLYDKNLPNQTED